MEGKNSTRSMQPKKGDGTQDVRRKHDANWFGASQEPQEEFSTDHLGDGGYHRPDAAAKPEDDQLTSSGSPKNH